MVTGSKDGIYQNAQSVSYLAMTLAVALHLGLSGLVRPDIHIHCYISRLFYLIHLPGSTHRSAPVRYILINFRELKFNLHILLSFNKNICFTENSLGLRCQ